jgi:hypothetical protein
MASIVFDGKIQLYRAELCLEYFLYADSLIRNEQEWSDVLLKCFEAATGLQVYGEDGGGVRRCHHHR